MVLVSTDLHADAYYYSGESHQYPASGDHRFDYSEIEHFHLGSIFHPGSGGDLSSCDKIVNDPEVESHAAKQNKMETVIDEICLTFGLTKKEFAGICEVKSRKTLYNWIDGKTKPRKVTLRRIFKLLLTARAWRGHEFTSDRDQLMEPVVRGQSVLELLNQDEIDQERIIFAGSRLHMLHSVKPELSDSFRSHRL